MYFSNIEQFKSLCGYEINGIWYPRVTKIIEIKSKPALYHYYAEAANYSEANAQTQKSAQEGTQIHEAVEKIFMGEEQVVEETIAPAIKALKLFLEQKDIQVDTDYVERRIFNSQHRYAGTIDALALIDGKFGVLDIKTSQAIYRDYNLQTSAYIAALSPEIKNLQTRWILRIDQVKKCQNCGAILRVKGGREKIRLPAKNSNQISCAEDEHQWSDLEGIIELQEFPYWKEDFQAFLGAKKLWEWENQYWLKNIGYL